VYLTKEGEGLYPLYCHYNYTYWGGEVPLREGVWKRDPSPACELGSPLHIRYTTGFHLFVRKRDAQHWLRRVRAAMGVRSATMRRVCYSDVVAKGWWEGYKVVVARRRFIEPSTD